MTRASEFVERSEKEMVETAVKLRDRYALLAIRGIAHLCEKGKQTFERKSFDKLSVLFEDLLPIGHSKLSV